MVELCLALESTKAKAEMSINVSVTKITIPFFMILEFVIVKYKISHRLFKVKIYPKNHQERQYINKISRSKYAIIRTRRANRS